MNERIKELAEQANNDVSGNAFSMARYNEKFAELIVQQCCEVFKKNWTMAGHEHPISKIKEHFGIE